MKTHTTRCWFRQVLLAFIFFTIASAQAQNDSSFVSPDGIFDKVYDQYGNTYPLQDMLISKTPKTINGLTVTTQTICTGSGYFNLYFETGSGFEGNSVAEIARRNVVCQLFNDISNFITPANPNVRVNIWVRDINNIVSGASGSGVLGLATSFYTRPSIPHTSGGIVDGEIWKTIHSGVDSYANVASPLITQGGVNLGFYHGMMAFNFSNPSIIWHTDLTTAPSSSLYDLYSVVLHEVTHSLGFASLINFNGNSKLGNAPNYYSRYDLFLQNQSGQNLIDNVGACTLYNYSFNNLLNPNTLLSPNPASCGGNIPFNGSLNNTTCGTAVKFAGAVNQAVYTPNCFEPPSSLSHLEDQCYSPAPYANDSYYCMSNASAAGSVKRHLQPEERQVLCDIGYHVGTTFGNSIFPGNFFNYGGAACPGLSVAGVNDGITSTATFQWSTTPNTPVTISGATILANDVNAVSFECLQDVGSAGTLNVTSGNSATNISYTPTSGGIALLRYVPVGVNGERGNITYIYVQVQMSGCSATPCGMVTNGEFESPATSCQFWQTNCWSTLTSSPDLYSRTCPGAYGIPTFSCSVGLSVSPQADTWNNGANGNNHMVGLYGAIHSGGTVDEEAIQSTLTGPITTGNVYTLRFWARAMPCFGPGQVNIAVCGSPTQLAISGTSYDPSNPVYTVLDASEIIPSDNLWHQVVHTFTYTGTASLNNLIIGYDINGASQQIGAGYVCIDAVELSPENLNATFAPPAQGCVNTVIHHLESYGTPPGGSVTGTGVTFSAGDYSLNPTTIGTYSLNYTYTNNIGCVTTIPATIAIGNGVTNLSVTASSTLACSGASVTLTASGATSYSWSPTASCTAPCNMAVVSPTANTIYTVTGNNGGCAASNTIAIAVSGSSLCCLPANVTVTSESNASAYTIPAGSVVDVLGTFIINTTVTYANVIFRMAPGAQILVRPNVTLTMSACHLFSCSDMWNGIYLQQTGNTAGNFIFNNGSTLEDAINGIVANMNSTSNAAIVKITNSQLNKNYHSVQILNYNGTTVYPLDISQSAITCTASAYSSGSTLKAPHVSERSSRGIYLSNVATITVGSSASAAAMNQFKNLDYGIYALNSTAKIVNNTFSMTGTIPSCSVAPCPAVNGIGIYAPNITLSTGGLSIGGTNTNEANVFQEVLRGIHIENMDKVTISGNTLSCSTTPAFPPGVAGLTSQYGVFLSNLKTAVNVTGNTLINFAYPICHNRNENALSAYNPSIAHKGNTIYTSGTGFVSRGIYLGDVAGNAITTETSIEITDNKLSDIRDFGIYVNSILNAAKITGSSANQQSVQMRYSASPVKGRYAIYVVSCEKTVVSQNEVYSTGSANYDIVGIFLRSSTKVLVKCNSIYTIGRCIHVDGDCSSPYQASTNYAAGIVNNKFANALCGLSFTSNGKIGQQGNPTHPTDNYWSGTAASYANGQTNMDATSSAINSKLYCRNTATPYWPTNHQAAAGGTAFVNGSTVFNASGSAPSCSLNQLIQAQPNTADLENASNGSASGSLQRRGVGQEANTNPIPEVVVYPNPNSGVFTLATNQLLPEVTLRITNLMGELIQEKQIKNFQNEAIDLRAYSNGIYHVSIRTTECLHNFKVIKQ